MASFPLLLLLLLLLLTENIHITPHTPVAFDVYYGEHVALWYKCTDIQTDAILDRPSATIPTPTLSCGVFLFNVAVHSILAC